jgi:hypothetical protein
MDIAAPFPRNKRSRGAASGAPGGPGIRGFFYRTFVYWPLVNPILWLGNWGRGAIVLLWLAALWWPQPMVSLSAFLGLCVVISLIARIDVARGSDVGRWYYAPFKSAERLLPLLAGPVIVGIGVYFLDQRATPGGVSRVERETMQFLLLISVLSILVASSLPMWGELARAFLGEPKNKAPASHGSAQFLTEIARLVGAEGLLIGRAGTALPYRYAGRILANPDPRHMVTVAANGAGKGVSAIVPNLLAYEGSVLAIDPKGELAAITARRRRARGQQVYILDPWALTGPDTASFNPLSILTDDNPDIVEDAALITDALVFDDGGSDPYWNLEARNMLQGLILHIATYWLICARTRRPMGPSSGLPMRSRRCRRNSSGRSGRPHGSQRISSKARAWRGFLAIVILISPSSSAAQPRSICVCLPLDWERITAGCG